MRFSQDEQNDRYGLKSPLNIPTCSLPTLTFPQLGIVVGLHTLRVQGFGDLDGVDARSLENVVDLLEGEMLKLGEVAPSEIQADTVDPNEDEVDLQEAKPR